MKIRLLQMIFYFRIGFSTYLALLIGAINVATSTYFLAVDKAPILKELFPTFEVYIALAIGIGFPVIIAMGWIHMKRIGTFSAESNVLTEEFPYHYRHPPGFMTEVIGPLYAMTVNLMIKRRTGEKLTDDEIRSIQKIDDDLTNLINGGHVGNPPKGAY